MEEVIKDALRQIPALALFVFITIHYLRSVKESAIAFAQTIERMQKEHNILISKVKEDCHSTQRDTVIVMGQVKEALIKNLIILEEGEKDRKNIASKVDRIFTKLHCEECEIEEEE